MMLAGACVMCWLGALSGASEASLPDGRVYEQVTPVDKNGGDVLPTALRTVAAADGSKVQFASLEGFGDVRGFGVSTDYVALRDNAGTWTTHGITPAQESVDLLFALATPPFEPRYVLFSDDLERGIFAARSPLTASPNVADALNLYVRDDVLAPGSGSFRLVSDASSPQAPDRQAVPAIADASADLSTVVFESLRNLTPEAAGLDTAEPKLYEWSDGALHMVGILPGNEGGAATVAQAGQGRLSTAHYTDGTVSQDGRRIIFTAPPFADNHAAGVLYVRDDQGTSSVADDATIRVSASERTDCNDDPSCGGNDIPDPTPDPSNPGGVAPPATFWAASGDGSKVFFTTSEQLTDDDVNHADDVYRFDLNAPQGGRLTRLSVDQELSDNAGDVHNAHDVLGVLGASMDGSFVYFAVAQGQLVAGGPTGSAGGPDAPRRIFVWHDGVLHEVGAVNGGVEGDRLVGRLGDVFPKWSRLTPDGKHLAFVTEGSHELLSLYGHHEYDHGSDCPSLGNLECKEVYIYDAAANGGAGDLRCASCNPRGDAATTDAEFSGDVSTGGASLTFHLNRSISDDGRFVFFNTREQLAFEDENGASDVYEFDTATNAVHLISSGRGRSDQTFLDASADGHDVFFTSRDELRSTDRDQSMDLYDARINGAPDPGVESVAPCAGDACKAPASTHGERKPPPTVHVGGAQDLRETSNVPALFTLQRLSAAQRRGLVRRGTLQVLLLLARPGRVHVTLLARVGSHMRAIDRASGERVEGGRVRLSLRLNDAARRTLARRGRIRIRVTAWYSQSAVVHSFEFTVRQGRA